MKLRGEIACLFVIAHWLSACSSSGILPGAGWSTTYYDRNHDGRIDYVIYDQPDMADEEWALSDTDFDGRYDVRYSFGVGTTRSRVDQLVPTSGQITPGQPRSGAER